MIASIINKKYFVEEIKDIALTNLETTPGDSDVTMKEHFIPMISEKKRGIEHEESSVKK